MIAEGTYYTANNNCIISYMKYRGRKMKKLFAVYFLIVLVILSSCNTKKVDLSKFSEANITYVYEDKNIHETLDDTDTNEIKNIFNGKMIYDDNPSCGFDDNISVRFGDEIFSIACDGCPVIRYKGEYIFVSEEDIEVIHNIMKKYGASFPSV